MSLVGRPAKNHPQQVSTNGARDDVDDRWTPPEVFDPLHTRFRFTLDVAASAENTKTGAFYTHQDNGLALPWQGRVWCNPPYSNIQGWVTKAWSAMLNGEAEVVVMLLPANRTEQSWWQEHIEPWRDSRRRRDGVRLRVDFLRGRTRFHRPGWVKPEKGDRPPFGLCVVMWERTPCNRTTTY